MNKKVFILACFLMTSSFAGLTKEINSTPKNLKPLKAYQKFINNSKATDILQSAASTGATLSFLATQGFNVAAYNTRKTDPNQSQEYASYANRSDKLNDVFAALRGALEGFAESEKERAVLTKSEYAKQLILTSLLLGATGLTVVVDNEIDGSKKSVLPQKIALTILKSFLIDETLRRAAYSTTSYLRGNLLKPEIIKKKKSVRIIPGTSQLNNALGEKKSQNDAHNHEVQSTPEQRSSADRE